MYSEKGADKLAEQVIENERKAIADFVHFQSRKHASQFGSCLGRLVTSPIGLGVAPSKPTRKKSGSKIHMDPPDSGRRCGCSAAAAQILSYCWVMPLGPFGDPGSGVLRYGNVSRYVSAGLIAPATVK